MLKISEYYFIGLSPFNYIRSTSHVVDGIENTKSAMISCSNPKNSEVSVYDLKDMVMAQYGDDDIMTINRYIEGLIGKSLVLEIDEIEMMVSLKADYDLSVPYNDRVDFVHKKGSGVNIGYLDHTHEEINFHKYFILLDSVLYFRKNTEETVKVLFKNDEEKVFNLNIDSFLSLYEKASMNNIINNINDSQSSNKGSKKI